MSFPTPSPRATVISLNSAGYGFSGQHSKLSTTYQPDSRIDLQVLREKQAHVPLLTNIK
jgi:hypothetical protein